MTLRKVTADLAHRPLTLIAHEAVSSGTSVGALETWHSKGLRYPEIARKRSRQARTPPWFQLSR